MDKISLGQANKLHLLIFTLSAVLFLTSNVVAQEDTQNPTANDSSTTFPTLSELLPNSLLQDNNGSGSIELAAFGDSITRGVGDFHEPTEDVEFLTIPTREAGYPLRVELLLDVPVHDWGSPGERISQTGIPRFIQKISGFIPDLVIISGGANDAFSITDPAKIFRVYQTLVNIAKASGTEVMLATITPSCCNKGGLEPITFAYNEQIRSIATINGLEVADVFIAFDNTCDIEDCYLLNRPEGLHPNSLGYDIFGETVIASLLRLNLFAADGAERLEQALNLSSGSVKTQPDPFSLVAKYGK